MLLLNYFDADLDTGNFKIFDTVNEIDHGKNPLEEGDSLVKWWADHLSQLNVLQRELGNITPNLAEVSFFMSKQR